MRTALPCRAGLLAGVIACVAVHPLTVAPAAAGSPWSQDLRSGVRLIGGASANDGTLRAGVEIKLNAGWKTYWRYPGDSGVPPRFDFSGSDNVQSARVLYPVPSLHNDETGQTLGYDNGVVFPVIVTPRESGKPVKLTLKIDYAVCEKLCVPAEGRAALALGRQDGAEEAVLDAALARVPKPATAAEVGLIARRVTEGAKPLVMIDIPAVSPGTQVFVEGPTPDWALPVPKPAQGAPAGRRHFSFELDGLPPGVDPKGAFDLTFTIVDGDSAREVTSRLQ